MKQRPRVLITGASKGLGRALAFRFGRQGAQLALVARNAGALDATVQELRGSGIDAIGITADLAKAKDAKRIAALAFEHLGAIDILIHNASTLGPTPLPRLDEIDDEDFEQVFQVGVLGPQRLTRSIIGNMALRGDGLVISHSLAQILIR